VHGRADYSSCCGVFVWNQESIHLLDCACDVPDNAFSHDETAQRWEKMSLNKLLFYGLAIGGFIAMLVLMHPSWFNL